jgi:hypothetical protein
VDKIIEKQNDKGEDDSQSSSIEDSEKEVVLDNEDQRLEQALYSKREKKELEGPVNDEFFNANRDNVAVMDFEDRNK